MTPDTPADPAQAELHSQFRPAIPPPRRIPWGSLLPVTGLLMVLVAFILGPIWPEGNRAILGDPGTDAIRGMWGLDHVRRSLVPPDTPLWSQQLNFPHGVLALILPFGSAILLSPAGALFGPIFGYNLSLALLLVAAGLSTAWLVKELGGSWASGAVAGAAFLSQPMLLFAISDGTPEHVAVWTMPAFLAATSRALRDRSTAWALGAGLLALLCALDGPYNAIFTAVLGALGLVGPAASSLRGDRSRGSLAGTVLVLASVTGLGAALVALIYANFAFDPVDPAEKARLLQMNAADLHAWWQFDFGPEAPRDASLAPTLMPTGVLVAALLLGLFGLWRSSTWMVAGTICLILSFGWNVYLPKELAQWLGAAGTWAGNWVLTINVKAYALPGIEGIRFPRRFLVPASMGLLVGGALGLDRLWDGLARRLTGPALRGLRVGTVLLLAVTSVGLGLRASRLHRGFPAQPVPQLEFARWLAEDAPSGGVITIPAVRAAPRSGKRADLPVFANLGEGLSSADEQYMQMLHGHPVVGYPKLKSLVPMRIDVDLLTLVRNWDDLSQPITSGTPIPRSAHDETSEPLRQATLDRLRREGLRFVVIDRAAYTDEGFQILLRQLELHTRRVHSFEDGTGVVIVELIDH